MVRNEIPVPVVESREFEEIDSLLYDDHFTAQELIQCELIRYVGRKHNQLYVRPLRKFSIFVHEVKVLEPGEILILELGETGRREFATWMED